MVRGIFVLAMVLLTGCRGEGGGNKSTAVYLPETDQALTADTGQIPVYDFKSFEPVLHLGGEKLYVVNFWATWCAPCIKEIPYFEQLGTEMAGQGVEVILVNLDMPRMWKSHMVPFINEHRLTSKVVVLDDPKQNDWIPKVAEEWGGGIPATLIYNKEKRTFYEAPFTYKSLKETLQNF